MNHDKLGWRSLVALLLSVLAVGSVSAATCESLAGLKLSNTTITIAQTVAAGAFTPASGSAAPYKDLPAFAVWQV